MTFRSPGLLWLAAAVGLVSVCYVASAARRRHLTVRFTALSLLASVAPRRPAWMKRHLAAVLLLLSLLALVLALARPTRSARVGLPESAVMLAIDVSESMVATDVAPSRLVGAQRAADAFNAQVPAGTRVGLVAFDATATVLVAPTTDRSQVRGAVDQLQPGAGTAIGDAIMASLSSLEAAAHVRPGAPLPPGGSAIVLLSDGATNHGLPNAPAAQAAHNARVPVDTVAYGTPNGTVTLQGQTIPVPVDAQALQDIATATGGSYSRALTAAQAQDIYRTLGRSIAHRTQTEDLTRWFIAAALTLGLLAAALSIALTNRLP
ncbi:MAG: VWA domain-containing protein [Mycobacteriaceae bacterium]|nr:VWA domain-containing protein [Mycobacteriaceae bacterium]